jgi:hypothetical protein
MGISEAGKAISGGGRDEQYDGQDQGSLSQLRELFALPADRARKFCEATYRAALRRQDVGNSPSRYISLYERQTCRTGGGIDQGLWSIRRHLSAITCVLLDSFLL